MPIEITVAPWEKLMHDCLYRPVNMNGDVLTWKPDISKRAGRAWPGNEGYRPADAASVQVYPG